MTIKWTDRAYSTVWQFIPAQGLYLSKVRALSRLSRFAAIQGSTASPSRADRKVRSAIRYGHCRTIFFDLTDGKTIHDFKVKQLRNLKAARAGRSLTSIGNHRRKSEQAIRFRRALSSITHETVSI